MGECPDMAAIEKEAVREGLAQGVAGAVRDLQASSASAAGRGAGERGSWAATAAPAGTVELAALLPFLLAPQKVPNELPLPIILQIYYVDPPSIALSTIRCKTEIWQARLGGRQHLRAARARLPISECDAGQCRSVVSLSQQQHLRCIALAALAALRSAGGSGHHNPHGHGQVLCWLHPGGHAAPAARGGAPEPALPPQPQHPGMPRGCRQALSDDGGRVAGWQAGRERARTPICCV